MLTLLASLDTDFGSKALADVIFVNLSIGVPSCWK